MRQNFYRSKYNTLIPCVGKWSVKKYLKSIFFAGIDAVFCLLAEQHPVLVWRKYSMACFPAFRCI